MRPEPAHREPGPARSFTCERIPKGSAPVGLSVHAGDCEPPRTRARGSLAGPPAATPRPQRRRAGAAGRLVPAAGRVGRWGCFRQPHDPFSQPHDRSPGVCSGPRTNPGHRAEPRPPGLDEGIMARMDGGRTTRVVDSDGGLQDRASPAGMPTRPVASLFAWRERERESKREQERARESARARERERASGRQAAGRTLVAWRILKVKARFP